MINRCEVAKVVERVFPSQIVEDIQRLTGGIDFATFRVEFVGGQSVVFRGQRNYTSAYLGPIDFGNILASEVRFFEEVSHLPVPRIVHHDPNDTEVPFPYAFFSYIPGRPLIELLDEASPIAIQSAMRDLGRYMAQIHEGRLNIAGDLCHPDAEGWSHYFSQRLRSRLLPYVGDFLSADDLEVLTSFTQTLTLEQPRLLHMDFRPANILAEAVGDEIHITGIVDAANAIAGDRLFDLARADEGEGLSDDFIVGYGSEGITVDRDSGDYMLYRLETAALLVHVYENTSDASCRTNRLIEIKNAILDRLR